MNETPLPRCFAQFVALKSVLFSWRFFAITKPDQRNMKLFRALPLWICSVIPLATIAQFRKYSNEFLNIGAGARGLAMGSAQVASVKDATAGYWNPAGLVGVKDNLNVAAMHAEYFAGIGKYEYAAIAAPVQDNKRTLGFSFLRFAVDDIPNTLYLVQPDGSVNYNNIETFSSADYAFLLSFAQNIKETEKRKMSFGVNAKVIRRIIGDFANSWGFGIDAAVKYNFSKWTIGAVLKDATTTFNTWSFSFSDKEKEILKIKEVLKETFVD